MENKDQIRALSDREQARTKLSVFFGSRDNYYHPLREILANSTDEINNHFDEGWIYVYLSEDKKLLSIYDSGRGIPHYKTTDGVLNSVLLFETLFAGTKYDNNDKINTGTNGLGTCTINYTSKLFAVETFDKNYNHVVIYKNGGQDKKNDTILNSNIEICGNKITHGTRVTFQLDDECYTNTTFSSEEVRNIIEHYASINNKIHILFKDGNEEVEEFYYSDIQEYLETKQKGDLLSVTTYKQSFDEKDEVNTYNVALSFATDPIQETYLNGTYLKEDGSIYNGFITEFTNQLNILEKKKYNKEDLLKMISFVITCESTNVEFSNQTKFSTNKRLYNSQMKKFTKEIVERYRAFHEKEYKDMLKMLDKIHQSLTRANAVNKKIKNELTKKVNIFNKVEGLVDCKDHNDSELYVVEGRSALGSIVQARNPKNQAVFPLRGKVLNTWNVSTGKLLENKEYSNLIKAIGVGVKNTHNQKDEIDITQSRYKKIIIATDADADGEDIASSLVSFFKKFLPEIIHNDMLYIIRTPLYVAQTDKDEYYYAYSESEKEGMIAKIKDKYTISRFKGLGEISAEEMARFGMNKETRILEKIQDDKDSVQTLENWFGNDTKIRKEMIMEEK